MKKRIALACFFILLTASVAFAADPLTVHNAGFGPAINGLQLGMPMSWPVQIATEKKITTTPAVSAASSPYLVPTPLCIFSMRIGDNYKAVTSNHPSSKPGKWIGILFDANPSPTIMNGGGGMLAKVPKSGSMDDLLMVLKKNGLNHASSPHLLVRDNRVIEYSVEKPSLIAEDVTAAEFAQWLTEKYTLGEMTKKGDSYQTSNPAEGWRALVSKDEVRFFTVQIPDSPKK